MQSPQPSIRAAFRGLRAALFAAMAAASLTCANAATWYVATNGSDSNAGTLAAPFASLAKAQTMASTGDTVYIRGGTYSTFTIASSDATFQYVHIFSKSGITYAGYPGDSRPVFDFRNIGNSLRIIGFEVTGSNNTFQDFDATGILSGSQTNGYCWRLSTGDGNHLLRLNMYNAQGTGIYLRNTVSNTLIENCDSHDNIGVSGVSAGNCDGFGCHSSGNGTIFRGCRSWHNSDDGFDSINAAGFITYDHCWSYNNGVNGGDANGFKVGGWGCSGGAFPNPPPVHTVKFCLAASNGSHGFYANHQPGKDADWSNNTAYNNAVGNFDMLEGNDSTDCSIPGFREVLHNNLAFTGTAIADDANPAAQVTFNSWTLAVTVTSADFQGIDPTQITAPRNADGSLPDIAFMHLAAGSDLIDAGTNLGFTYNGAAPDLGCFESGGAGPTLPPAPTGVAATAVSSSQISVSWSASAGATSYNVKRATVSGGPYTVVAGGVTNVSVTDGGLASSTTYFYVVSAVNAAGESANSAEASATTQTPPPPPPAAPSALAASAISASQINVTWTDNATNETGFKIERSTDNVTFAQIATAAVNATSYSDSGLSSGVTYYYRVRATNTGGDSAYSNTTSATTLTTPPAAPSSLSATGSKRKISLSWTDNATNETGFKIERSSDNVTFTQIATVAANVTTYTNSGLNTGATLYYRVRAYNSNSDSSYSNVASATVK